MHADFIQTVFTFSMPSKNGDGEKITKGLINKKRCGVITKISRMGSLRYMYAATLARLELRY